MNYVEFIKTIKLILRYEGNEIQPYDIQPTTQLKNMIKRGNIGMEGGFKVGQFHLTQPLREETVQEYEDFIDDLKHKSYELPEGETLDSSSEEGWYISTHPDFEGYPAIHYYNPKDKGDWGEKSVYIFNPYELNAYLWFNRYSLQKNIEIGDFAHVNYYVGLDILNNINTIKFINWPLRNPMEVKE